MHGEHGVTRVPGSILVREHECLLDQEPRDGHATEHFGDSRR